MPGPVLGLTTYAAAMLRGSAPNAWLGGHMEVKIIPPVQK
jgi:hypothetical protein